MAAPTFLILHLLFIPALLLGYSEAFDNAHQIADTRISTQSPHMTSNSDSCVGQCAFVFMNEMTAQFGASANGTPSGILNLNYNDFLNAFSNRTFFEKFCNLYHKFAYCYMQCPHGYMQELLQRSAEIVDHFCVYNYKAIMDKFGCLGNLDREVSKQCLKTCTSHHNAVTSLMQNFKELALNGDSTQAEHYLAESCEYVICTLHCDVPAIAHVCDFETAELVINLTKRSFDSMQRMALDTGAVARWPTMCADIRTYALPRAPQSPPTSVAFDGRVVENISDASVIAQSPTVNTTVKRKHSTKEKRPAKRGRNAAAASHPSPSILLKSVVGILISLTFFRF